MLRWPTSPLPFLLLLGYVGLLLGLGVLGVEWDAWVRPIGLGHVRDERYVLGWLAEVAAATLLTGVRFGLVGVLAVLTVRARGGDRAWRSPTGVRGVVVALGVSLLAGIVVRAVEMSTAPRPGALVVPALGCALGVWTAAAWRQGDHGRGRVFVPVALLMTGLGVMGLLGASALLLAVQTHPLPLEVPRVTVADKRQLRAVFAGGNPRALAPGATHTIQLSQDELNQLLAWGLALEGPRGHRAQVELAEGQAVLRATIALPAVGRAPLFLNVTASGSVSAARGALAVDVQTLRVGRVEMPRWSLHLLVPAVARLWRSDPRVQALLEPIEWIEIHRDAVRVTYGRLQLPRGLIADVFRGEQGAAHLLPSVGAQVEHLVATAPSFPGGDRRFAAALETAFELAHQRSSAGRAGRGAAVVENKAAILALGILGGHWRIEQALGSVMDPATRARALRALRGTTLRGRPDWARHFLASAAIAVLTDEGISLAAGVLKEEMDAQKGSGFSFADLLADRAGTMFATAAMRDPASAAAMQARLVRGIQVDDVFPSAEGLPEGVSDQELESRYGGIEGARYRELIEEIDRRLAALALAGH